MITVTRHNVVGSKQESSRNVTHFFYSSKDTNGKLSNHDMCCVYIVVNIQDFTSKRLRDPIQFQKLNSPQQQR